MKNKILFLLFSILFSFDGLCHPDLIIYSRANTNWNSFLIKEVEQIISNFSGEVKFYSARFDEQEISYDSTKIEEFLTEDTISFIEKIEELSRFGFLEAKPEFRLKGFGYDVQKLSPHIDLEALPEGILFKTKADIDGLDIYANSFEISFIVPELNTGKKLVAFSVRILNPSIKFSPGVILPIDTNVSLLKTKEGKIQINLDKLNSEVLAETLQNSIHGFDFQFTDLEITDVEMEIMGRNVSIDKRKIKETITSNKDFLKKLLLDQMSNLISRDGLFSLAKKYDGEKYPSNFWFNTAEGCDYPFNLEVESFDAIHSKLFRVDINGNFCTHETFSKYGDQCALYLEDKPYELIRSQEEFQKSIQNVESIVTDEENNMVISIDEHYLTKIINATILNGEWDKILEEKGLKWGPKKAFVRMNKKGDRAQLYMDVIYKVGNIQGLLIGQHNVRFPIILDIKTSFEYRRVDTYEEHGEVLKDEVLPHIVFTIMDAEIDDDTIWFGKKELGLISSIQDVRWGLRGIVVGKVQEELFEFDEESQSYSKVWMGVELPPLIFTKIRDLSLEKLLHKNDGMGRMNLIAPINAFEMY